MQPLTSTTREEFIADCKTKYTEAQGIYRHFKGDSNKVRQNLLDRGEALMLT